MFAAGWCNLDCKYCYIPKKPFIKDIHQTIIKKIRDGSMLKEIKEIYGKELTILSHWGTEPTLTTHLFGDFYREIIKEFPKFHEITLSSNFMTPPENIVKFITEILPTEKSLDINIQMSLDGPIWITDKNRGEGNTKQIIKHVRYFYKELNKRGTVHRIRTNVKPTVDNIDIKKLSKYDILKEYYEFFDDTFGYWLDGNKIIRTLTKCDPTIVCPMDYTVEDGKNFHQLGLHQFELGKLRWKHITQPINEYFIRFKDRAKCFSEFFSKHRMFTCSAGDSSMGISNKPYTLHNCHRTYYMTDERYECLQSDVLVDNDDTMLKDKIVDYRDKAKLIRHLYVNRGYHDFGKLLNASGVAIAHELAIAGQISECYKKPELGLLLTLMISTGECFMDAIPLTGSMFAKYSPYYRLFGNGFFETILEEMIK